MTAPQEEQAPVSRETETKAIRKQLKKAAAREPELQPLIDVLRTQLGNFDRGDSEDKAALRPEIEKSAAAIEKAVHGR